MIFVHVLGVLLERRNSTLNYKIASPALRVNFVQMNMPLITQDDVLQDIGVFMVLTEQIPLALI